MSDQRLSGSINKLILYSIAWLGDIVRLLIQGVHLLPKWVAKICKLLTSN